MTTAEIQTILSNTTYKVVNFIPGDYTLTSFLQIERSNVIVNGNGAILNLDDNVNTPLIVIGSMVYDPAIYENIIISDFTLNGNKANQSSDVCDGFDLIDTSALVIRSMHNIKVYRMNITNAYCSCINVCAISNNVNIANCALSSSNVSGVDIIEGSIYVNVSECTMNSCVFGVSINNSNYIEIVENSFDSNQYGIHLYKATNVNISNNIINYCTNNAITCTGQTDLQFYQNVRYTIIGNVIDTCGESGMSFFSCAYFVISGNTISTCTLYGIMFSAYDVNQGISSYCNITNNIINVTTGVSALNNDASNCLDNYSVSNFFTNNLCKADTPIIGDISSFTIFSLGANYNGSTDDLLTTDGAGNFEFVSRSEAGPTYSGSAGIDVSGTFPNFTITNLIDIDAGDRINITGTYPNHTISTIVPAFNQALFVAADDIFSTTYIATPYEITITPKFATSRVKITVSNGTMRSTTGTAYLTIFRDNSVNLAGSVGLTDSLASITPLAFAVPVSMCIVDLPNTTSPVTYTAYMCCGSGHLYFNEGNTVAVIAEEIFV
jgi:hypothetical protein